MASERQRFNQAFNLWDEHVVEQRFSVPSEIGTTAIMVPYSEPDGITFRRNEQLPQLSSEAESIADEIRAKGRLALVATGATKLDFERVLTDEKVSDVILVGHGCLASFYVETDDGRGVLDWGDIALMTNHVKQGRFTQRMCAGLPRELNVPAGLFAVTDHRNVQAVVGKRMTNRQIAKQTLQDGSLPRVTSLPVMNYHDIREAFPRRELTRVDRAHVALGALKNHVLGRDK